MEDEEEEDDEEDGPALPSSIMAKLEKLGGGGGRPSVLMRVTECLKQVETELVILQRLLAEIRSEMGVE